MFCFPTVEGTTSVFPSCDIRPPAPPHTPLTGAALLSCAVASRHCRPGAGQAASGEVFIIKCNIRPDFRYSAHFSPSLSHNLPLSISLLSPFPNEHYRLLSLSVIISCTFSTILLQHRERRTDFNNGFLIKLEMFLIAA